MYFFNRCAVGLVALTVLAGCISVGNAKFNLTRDFFTLNYAKIRDISIEEAASNGFGTLTSEVKPSEYNDWTGGLFFQLKTTNGTDQLFVDFRKDGTGVNIWVHGAGTRSNPDSAAKAIQARVGKLAGVPNPASTLSSTETVLPPPATRTQSAAKADADAAAPTAVVPAIRPDVQTRMDERAVTMSPAEIQQRLIDLKYLTGSADGKFGRNSIDALKKFQQANGIAPTGIPDSETLAKIKVATRR